LTCFLLLLLLLLALCCLLANFAKYLIGLKLLQPCGNPSSSNSKLQ
jgi:hypothetical protein